MATDIRIATRDRQPQSPILGPRLVAEIRLRAHELESPSALPMPNCTSLRAFAICFELRGAAMANDLREVLQPVTRALDVARPRDPLAQAQIIEATFHVNQELIELKFRRITEAQPIPQERPEKAAKGRPLDIDAILAAALLLMAGAAVMAAIGALAAVGYIRGVIASFVAGMILSPRFGA